MRTTKNSTPPRTTPISTPSKADRRGSGFWADIRDDLRDRREARTARAHLVKQLDGYHSRSDILDLLAAADRYDGAEAELMRDVLNSKLAHAERGSLRVG